MILEVNSILKEILTNNTILESSNIFTTPLSSHSPKPSVSITLDKGTFTPAWHWEQKMKAQPHSKTQRKYNTIQPILLHFSYNDKGLLVEDIHSFLEKLPRYGVCKQVEFVPIEIEYLLAEGVLGDQQAKLQINAQYGIVHTFTNPIIQNISIQTTNQ